MYRENGIESESMQMELKESEIPSDVEELRVLFGSNSNRGRGRGRGRGRVKMRNQHRGRGNGWTTPMNAERDESNESSDSLDAEMSRALRRSTRSREGMSEESEVDGSVHRSSSNRKGNRSRVSSHGNWNSSEEFEESEDRVNRKRVRRESIREEKRRRGIGSWRESTEEMEEGNEEEMIHGLVGLEEGEEGEGVYVNTIMSKNGQVVSLPEIHPPPNGLSHSLSEWSGCHLCKNRKTDDMVVCTRCNEEYHASCLYGNEMDYNNWLCDSCSMILSEMSKEYKYLRLESEVNESGLLARNGFPSEKKVDSVVYVNRMRWLKSMWNELVGNCVYVKMGGKMELGRVLYVNEMELKVYLSYRVKNWLREGWYCLERSEVCVCRRLVWLREKEGVGIGWLVERYGDVKSGDELEVYDMMKERVMLKKAKDVSLLNDWREHKLELVFSSEEDVIRWELHVRKEIGSYGTELWSVPRERLELSGKEWMYKWIYVWSRNVDYPLGGWARGVVLHYRSLTGKHFVWFENEDVESGWLYLNGEYVIMEGVCNEDLLSLQPSVDEYCWCCLHGGSEEHPLYRCKKCGLYIHLQCSDSIGSEENVNEPFVCFACTKCSGCGTEVSFYGHWEEMKIGDEHIQCCEECKEKYGKGLYCKVCLHTIKEEDESCIRCKECNGWVHKECDGGKKSSRGHREEEVCRSREGSMFEGENEEESVSVVMEKNVDEYMCPSCRRNGMVNVLKKLESLDPRGVFERPITEDIAPNYFDIVSRENVMCFEWIRNRLKEKQYVRSQQLRDDFEMMCYNAFVYNGVGDEVWECANKVFDEGEKVMDDELKGSVLGKYGEKVEAVRSTKVKSSIRPEASKDAKQASMEASKMVRYIEKIKVDGSRLDPLVPLAAPYSVMEISTVTERLLPRYGSIIPLETCVSCGSCGDRESMLFCADCGEAYHIYCMSLSGTVNEEMRNGWRCMNCKVCEVCGLPLTSLLGDGDAVCSCNQCDRSFHKSCLKYSDENNLSLLVCGWCFHCKKCGLDGTPTTWSYHKDYCRSCYLKEERFRLCAVCGRPWSVADSDMGFCESCEQWIHRRCLSNDLLEWQKCDLTRIPYHCKRCRSISMSLLSNESSHNSISGLVSLIQEHRQELRLRDLVQGDEATHMMVNDLSNSLCVELARIVIRANSILMATLPLKNQLKELNENGWGRRDRLNGNIIAEDIVERSHIFLQSRLDGHQQLGERIQSISVSDVRSGGSPERVSEEVLRSVLQLYGNPLLLLEDASKASAYLFIAQGVFPWLFDSSNPFSSLECLLITGNGLFPPVGKEKKRKKGVVGLCGLRNHGFEDNRVCDLCGKKGDSVEAGRMLCTLTGEWVHLNCVYYSNNISIDEKTGAIQKYTQMKNKSRSTRCAVCEGAGASIRCSFQNCGHAVHFACGREEGCLIRVNKEMLCPRHRPGRVIRNRVGEDHESTYLSVNALANLPVPTKPSFHPNGGILNRSDGRVTVNSMELFTTRFNYRVVFPPLKL